MRNKKKIKEALEQVFSCKSWSFFYRTNPVAASDILFKYLYLPVSIIIEILNWFFKYLSFAFAKNLFSLKREKKVFHLSLNENHSVRSSHRCSVKKKAFLEILQNSQENTCASLFFNEVPGLGPEKETLLKKRLSRRCFPVNFAKFLRTPFFTDHLRTTASVVQITGFCQNFLKRYFLKCH